MKRLRRMRCIQAGKFVPGMKVVWAESALHTRVLDQVFGRCPVARQGQGLDSQLRQDSDDLIVELCRHSELPFLSNQ